MALAVSVAVILLLAMAFAVAMAAVNDYCHGYGQHKKNSNAEKHLS